MGNEPSTSQSFFLFFFLLRCLLILHIYGLSKTQEGQLDGGEDREMKLQTRGGMTGRLNDRQHWTFFFAVLSVKL